MAKRFKQRISRMIPFPSFQFCRSEDPSTMPENPIPVFRLSPVNPKTIDIHFPATTTVPVPVPAPTTCTPSSSSFNLDVPSDGCPSKPAGQLFTSNDTTESPPPPPNEFSWKKEEKWHVVAIANEIIHHRKSYNSSVSEESVGYVSPPPAIEKKKKQRNQKNKSKPRIRISTSSADDSGWFSSEGGDENDEEDIEALISCSRTFSTDSSSDFDTHLETIRESPIKDSSRRVKQNLKRIRRLKRHVTRSSNLTRKTMTCQSPETEATARLSVFRRDVEGKVRESFAVVKKSEDPYEDFKRSMMEMIMEKQMFEDKDLEQLLHCFLSLNSRHHHGIIVEAFSEIWEDLFCKSPSN